MALNIEPPSAWPRWSEVPAWAKSAAWLVLFVLLARLLYLPSSQTLAGTEHAALEAPRNTAIVLESVERQVGPAATLLFEDFESFTLQSERAALTENSRAMLASLGADLPPDAAPRSLSWNVNLPPGEDAALAPGFLRVELYPAEDADLSLGTLDGNLRLGSPETLELIPVAQDYQAIGGWLRLDEQPTLAPEDIMPQIRLLPEGAEEGAAASLSWRAADPELLLGDPFGADVGLSVRSIAHVDEAGNLVRRYCGAPEGGLLWSAMFQPRLEPQPTAEACRTGELRASTIRFSDGAIRVELGGSAYVPGASQLLEKLQGNIVLWPVLAALIAIPGQKVLKTLLAMFARKEKDSAPA